MIDPLLSLAFSVQSQKGVYALLLGSGVSRSSGIPTGWEVVLDLIRKLARLHGEDCEPNPEEWFRKKHSAEPDYSKLLDALAQTPAGRQQLLRNYFEPSEDERSQNLKSPTPAHKAIASLVLDGYVRVILTTNFDRLMEKALEEAGVHPTVINTPDAVSGALPLVHAGCTIIKLHGDYLDTRIRNTPAELDSYDAVTGQLLDRVLDEYGLVVCGWSGEWDSALRAAITRAPARRFATFWADRGNRNERARQLIEHRKAQVVTIKDADQFFVGLEESVKALAESCAPHPLSAKVLVATVKRYLADDVNRIRLFDLVSAEVEKVLTVVWSDDFSLSFSGEPKEELPRRVHRLDSLISPLAELIATGCYWGNERHVPLWSKSIERMASSHRHEGVFNEHLLKLRKYPALVLSYAAGLGCIAAGNYRALRTLFERTEVSDDIYEKREPLASGLTTWNVMEQSIGHLLLGMERRYTPVSDYLFGLLRKPLSQYLPNDIAYQEAFDRFEYFQCLTCATLSQEAWVPLGAFGWRHRHSNQSVFDVVDKEIEQLEQSWPPLQAGLFGGTVESFQRAAVIVEEQLKRMSWH
jgi:hypothetical protein